MRLWFLLLLFLLAVVGCREASNRSPTAPAIDFPTAADPVSDERPLTKPPRRIETH